MGKGLETGDQTIKGAGLAALVSSCKDGNAQGELQRTQREIGEQGDEPLWSGHSWAIGILESSVEVSVCVEILVRCL